MKREGKDVRIIRRYSEALKQKVVEEIEGGVLTVKEAMDAYAITHRKTVNRWVRKHGKSSKPTQVVRVMMKSEQEKIRELEKALASERIRNMVFEAQLERYQHYVPDLKKRLSTKELKQFEENEQKIKGFR